MIKFVFAVLHVASALERLDCMKTRTDADCRTGDKCAKVEYATGARWPLDPYICVEADQCGNYFSAYPNTVRYSAIKWDCAGAKPKP